MNLPALVLASASPRRAELLRQAGFEFAVVRARIREVQPEHLTPHEIAQINACRKSRSVARKHPDALVLGADTIVCLGRQILGKPASMAEAGRMLARLQGRTHEVVTGVCLTHWRTRRQRVLVVSTAVTFHRLDARRIRRYLAKVNPLDKAGGYAIQEEGDDLVRGIHGSYTNVVGLPMEQLKEELGRWRA
ncbi:MAG: septum formation protein Maf [Verrucomicrobia bacterium]|nr:septum formation protein Maf [Verrucomicrobiota bacterium]